MPNEQELKRAEARRAKRKASQEANAAMAADEAVNLKVDKEVQAKARAAAEAAKSAPSAPPQKKVTRAEQVRAAKAAAEAQVMIESRRKPAPMPDNYKPGDTVPLHVLNQRAQLANAEARDMATEIGKKVGQFTRDVVSTRVPKQSAFQRRYDIEAKQAGMDLQAKQVK